MDVLLSSHCDVVGLVSFFMASHRLLESVTQMKEIRETPVCHWRADITWPLEGEVLGAINAPSL